MGVRVTVGGTVYETSGYSVSEESSPLSAGDTSGSVGSFSITGPPVQSYQSSPGIFPDPSVAPVGTTFLAEDPANPGYLMEV